MLAPVFRPVPLSAQSAVSSVSSAKPESTYVRTHYRKQVARIPMRDGATLYTVIYRPRDASPAVRYPVVLTRTPFSVAPYDTTVMPAVIAPDPVMLRDGYIFVQQEVRGRYLSEGTFENVRPLTSDARTVRTTPRVDEATDAWDTIAWLLSHITGHNGRVGLHGVSYGGYYAGLAAAVAHPAVQAVSLQAPVADFWHEDFHHNGAFLLGNAFAVPIFGTPRAAPTASHWWLPAFLRASAADTGSDYRTLLAVGPLRSLGTTWYAGDTWWRDIVLHPDHDGFWQRRSLIPHLPQVRVPALVVGGWYDAENLWGSLASHAALRGRYASLVLAMGPFAHRAWSVRDSGSIVHGAQRFADAPAQHFQREIEAPFFRAALKQDGARRVIQSAAHVYDTGRGAWRRFARWPVRGTPSTWYLAADGALLTSPPTRDSLEFVSDPADPVPSRCEGPTIEDGGVRSYLTDDQRCLRGRADVLQFRSAPLTRDVTIAGPLSARITVSTSATDLDVVVKLVDVYPDPRPDVSPGDSVHAGREQLVRGEIVRARHRRGNDRAVPMRPNAAEEVTVSLPDVMHTFRKGHRIMVQLHSSWFPLFDRNPQRFVPNIYEARAEDFVAARHRVFTGTARGSRLTATVLP